MSSTQPPGPQDPNQPPQYRGPQYGPPQQYGQPQQGPQYGYGQQPPPPGQPPAPAFTPPPKKRKKWPFIAGAVAALVIVVAAVDASNDPAPVANPKPVTATSAPTSAAPTSSSPTSEPTATTLPGTLEEGKAAGAEDYADPDIDEPRAPSEEYSAEWNKGYETAWNAGVAADEKKAEAKEKAEAAAKAKAEKARKSKINDAQTVTTRTMAKILKNPDKYKNKVFVVYGEVTQFDSATGTESFRADVANRNTTSYGYFDGENAILNGTESKLDDLVEDDIFRATVTVTGSYTYDTQIGGSTTVAEFKVEKIKVIG